ncbi:unnamed protein product [Arctogadus glacialis]
MVCLLQALENLSGRVGSNTGYETILELKDPNANMHYKPLNLLSDFQPIRVTERQTVILEIRDVKARDAGGYDISVGDLRATRTLLVGQRFFAVKSDMSDVLCPTGAPAELCVALDDEKVDRAWFKYGVEVRTGSQGPQ